MQNDIVRTVLYTPHCRVHKTDKALLYSKCSYAHPFCTKFTEVRRLAALARPGARIGEQFAIYPSVTTNTSQPPPDYLTYR